MDRRQFLGLMAGTVVLGACGGGGKSDLVLVPNDWDFFAGGEYRLAILLATNKANGAPVQLNAPVTLRVGSQGQKLGPPIPMTIHTKGPEPAYAMTTYTFPVPGTYNLEATYKGQKATLPIQVIPLSQSEAPAIGAELPAIPTPTVANPMGLNPLCTQQPPCPFHQVSLDAALNNRQPVALLFATPALCQSRFCGPVLMNIQAVAKAWTDRVTFIHCEIYTDLSGQTETRPVQSFNLQHEPMLYLAGPDGVIKTRIDNLFDQDEAAAALKAAFS